MKTPIFYQSIVKVCLFLLIAVFTFVGCKTKQEKEPASAEEPVKKEAVIEEISGYPLPTSFEITKMLNEARAPYILSICNTNENVGNYFLQKEKALNLGVYGADLSYASTYNMKQETMLYLEASKRLTDEMEISTAFNLNYVERIENNLENGDSMISIISDSFYDTYNHLIINKKDKLAILVMTGSWIEGLYITTQIAITAGDNTKFLDIITNQESSLKKLLEIMEPLKEDEDVSEIHGGLMDLNKIYDTIEEELTEKQLEEISNSIETLRNKIV
ncbi:hypothetical protein ES708_00401 [subsurface metagenome]